MLARTLFTPPATVCPQLGQILETKRPHGSSTEQAFVDEFLVGAVRAAGYQPERREDNLVVCVPLPDGKPRPILFSCHTDTMHKMGGSQTITYDPNMGDIFVTASDCLGADDGVGVWLMLNMIAAKVAGTYVFHRGEERGCIGSKAMAAKHGDWLRTFTHAIAFDRPGNAEVITHQLGGQRMASDQCANAIAGRLLLADGRLRYVPSNRGMVTDTAQYRYCIPECLNLGVGYSGQHGPGETLDFAFASALRDALVVMPWSGLPVAHTVATLQAVDTHGYSTTRPAPRISWPMPLTPPAQAPRKQKAKAQAPLFPNDVDTVEPPLVDELENMRLSEIADIIADDPRQGARWIAELIAEVRGAEHRFKALRDAWRNDEA